MQRQPKRGATAVFPSWKHQAGYQVLQLTSILPKQKENNQPYSVQNFNITNLNQLLSITTSIIHFIHMHSNLALLSSPQSQA